MDEELMRFLQDQFNKINERFNKVDERFDKIDERFNEIEGEISIIKEQTAKNSEMLSIIEDYGKRIYNLETDVSIIKKAMRS